MQAWNDYTQALMEAGVFARRRGAAAERDRDHAGSREAGERVSPTARSPRPRSSSAAST